MEKLRFTHQASVESPFVNGSLGFWKRAGTDFTGVVESQDCFAYLHSRNAPSTVRSPLNPRFFHLRRHSEDPMCLLST